MATASKSAPSVTHTDPMWKKAYDAYNNAKQRCTNPKHKDYANYGKLGVKVLFPTFGEFLSHIGLPPTQQVSLDRINPHGNYELGNVRWASKAVQAHNKKGSPTASYLPLDKQIAHIAQGKLERETRSRRAKCWMMMISAINRGRFTQAEIDYVAAAKLPLKTFQSGWELGQVIDFADHPSYFHMPALTDLWGGAIRLAGGPLLRLGESHGGVLFGLEPPVGSAFEAFKGGTFTAKCGVAMIGGQSDDWLKLGGVEGIFLFAASRFYANNQSSTVWPVLLLLEMLTDLGAPWEWPEVHHPILDAKHLLIPDFQIDFGDAVNPTAQEWSRLAKLVDYRLEHGKRTYVGVQNPQKLPKFLRDKLLEHFQCKMLPEIPEVPDGPDFEASGPKANNVLGFEAVMQASKAALGKML